jgi:hypothetical protein
MLRCLLLPASTLAAARLAALISSVVMPHALHDENDGIWVTKFELAL